MKIVISTILLFTVNTAMADFSQAVEAYRANQANQDSQNTQSATSTQSTESDQSSTTNNTVIYAPQDESTAPRGRGAVGYKAGQNNGNNQLQNRAGHPRGAGSFGR